MNRYMSSAAQATINIGKLTVRRTTTPKPKPPNKELQFGHSFSDHMFAVDWIKDKGWQTPRIERMKAYKDKDNKIRLFRPEMNMNRFLRSCQRLALPDFDTNELLKGLKEFVKVDQDWIPKERGYSLYLRPTAIGTQNSLGVGPSNRATIFIIASPVGPYYKTGFSAVSLYATSKYVRAWPNGTGDCKIGGNYAPGIKPQLEVMKDGYQQILWLFGEHDNVTEVGTMNFFAYWINEKGEKELITPHLDGTILPGVTRDSILSLARSWGEFKVTEGSIPMARIVQAVKEKRLLELFGAGTAAIVSPIKKVNYNGADIDIPLDPKDPNSQAGPLTRRFMDTIMGIQYGDVPHKWSVVVD